MSVSKTNIALDSRLIANFPSTPIAPEGVGFNPPAGNYFRVNLKVNKPDDPVLGSRYRRENMIYQVFVTVVSNAGKTAALTIAEQVATVFRRATFIAVDNLRIHVLNSPQVGSVIFSDKRLVVPVLIPVTVEVQE
jgi:hypothetical protein